MPAHREWKNYACTLFIVRTFLTIKPAKLGQEVFGGFVYRTDRRSLHVRDLEFVCHDVSLGMLCCKSLSTPLKVANTVPMAGMLTIETMHEDYPIYVVSKAKNEMGRTSYATAASCLT